MVKIVLCFRFSEFLEYLGSNGKYAAENESPITFFVTIVKNCVVAYRDAYHQIKKERQEMEEKQRRGGAVAKAKMAFIKMLTSDKKSVVKGSEDSNASPKMRKGGIKKVRGAEEILNEELIATIRANPENLRPSRISARRPSLLNQY
jgi:hypothetical protein